jgi:hypothetical protein
LEPEPRLARENVRTNTERVFQRHIIHEPSRVFLSQAGPRFDLALVQAEHHLLFGRSGETKRATVGRPRLLGMPLER